MSEPIVTVSTVGTDLYLRNPWAHRAVNARISQPEFIRLLLEENERLTQMATELLMRRPPPPIIIPRGAWDGGAVSLDEIPHQTSSDGQL